MRILLKGQTPFSLNSSKISSCHNFTFSIFTTQAISGILKVVIKILRFPINRIYTRSIVFSNHIQHKFVCFLQYLEPQAILYQQPYLFFYVLLLIRVPKVSCHCPRLFANSLILKLAYWIYIFNRGFMI